MIAGKREVVVLHDIAVVVVDHRDHRMASAIVAVQRASYAVEARLIGFDGIPAMHESAADVMTLDLTILAVIEHGQPVAILGYSRDGDRVEIDRLAVHPDHFRRGLARRLIQSLHEREAVVARVEVSTGCANEPAKALYRRMGYREVDNVALPEGVVITRFVREL